MVLAYTAIGVNYHLCVCETSSVLSMAASAEHSTINISHPRCRGSTAHPFSHHGQDFVVPNMTSAINPTVKIEETPSMVCRDPWIVTGNTGFTLLE